MSRPSTRSFQRRNDRGGESVRTDRQRLSVGAALTAGDAAFPSRRHRSEQKRTFSQSRAHFFRHVNGRPQAAHGLLDRVALRCMLRSRLRAARHRASGRTVVDMSVAPALSRGA